MGLLDFLFKNKAEEQKTVSNSLNNKEGFVSNDVLEEWVEVPAYIEANETDYELVSIIATIIAASDQPKSKFQVTKILKRNPEAKKVALIASSLAAVEQDKSKLRVTKMLKRKGE